MSHASPARMLHKPKKRICPSLRPRIWVNMRRQPPGDRKGSRPSITRTRASASQKLSLLTPYFFGAAPWPRKTLKKSVPLGSTTITSFLLAKLAL